MKQKIRQTMASMKEKIAARLKPVEGGREPRSPGRPELTPTGIDYELAARTQATSSGGIGAMLKLAKTVGLIDALDQSLDDDRAEFAGPKRRQRTAELADSGAQG